MRELITFQRRHESIHRRLMATVSSIPLFMLVMDMYPASAREAEPSVWIELGGQLERMDGRADAYLPPFTRLTPPPDPYSLISPAEAEKPSLNSHGLEGKITFVPSERRWAFSASLRYGRSNNNKYVHQQTAVKTPNPKYHAGQAHSSSGPYFSQPKFSNTTVTNKESHLVLDFQVGKDVGLGLFGRESSSLISVGIRLAELEAAAHDSLVLRPDVIIHKVDFGTFTVPFKYNNTYVARNDSSHSFHGVGPALSWNASTPITKGSEGGLISVDWGLNGAVLFGRQKAVGAHEERKRYYARRNATEIPPYGAQTLYDNSINLHRAKSVVVPNVGAFAAISFRYSTAKVSFGYRADYFVQAMDQGGDAYSASTLGFRGPFATISLGFGGHDATR